MDPERALAARLDRLVRSLHVRCRCTTRDHKYHNLFTSLLEIPYGSPFMGASSAICSCPALLPHRQASLNMAGAQRTVLLFVTPCSNASQNAD
jgi:hypothetical protein